MTRSDIIREAFVRFMAEEHPHEKGDDNAYHIELYADYRDTLERETLNKEVFSQSSPREALYELLLTAYDAAAFQEKADLISSFKSEFLSSEAGPAWDEEDESLLAELCDEMVYFDVPMGHYLKMTYPVNIYLDIRDSNYDFTLAMHYPHWAKGEDEQFDDNSCVVWLAKQQGYTKEQLESALNGDGVPEPKGFLQTLRSEELNCNSCMLTVGFMVMMDLDSILDLNERLQLHEKMGHENRRVNDDSVVIISKDTTCGLMDPWDGGGGTLDLELDKDVELPISAIYSALPDGGEGLSNLNWYGISEASVYKPLKALDIKDLAT